jgi:perosamine synthetase
MSMKRFNEKELEAVKQIIENGEYLSGFTTSFRGGENVQKFEKNFARFIGMKYAISVNSGTAALFISFKAIMEYALNQNKKKFKNPNIHLPACTFTADPSAALMSGGKIIFEDIDKKTFCMIPPKSNSMISVPTYLLGNANGSDNYKKADFLIEDCCQALGTEINGKKVGSFGDLSIFSFQETKHITTLGEGGMICSNNDELIDIIAGIRNHAEFYSEKKFLGGNFRMTEVQAAFGIVQLKKIVKILKSFRSNAKLVMKNLPDGISAPYIPSNVNHSFLVIGCLFDEKKIGVTREKFLEKLTKNRSHILRGDKKSDIKGINMKSGKLISTGYSAPLYEIEMYKKFKPKNGCPNAKNFTEKSLWMDIHKFRKKDEIMEEIEILTKTIGEFNK